MKFSEVETKRNPTDTAPWWSLITFSYLSSLLSKAANGQTVTVEDTYKVSKEDTSQILGDKLEREWIVELDKYRQTGKANLVAALFRAHGKNHVITGAFAFMEELGSVMQPVFLTWLLGYFSADSSVSRGEAWCYSIGICLAALLQAVTGPQIQMRNEHTIACWRSATRALFLRKVLRMSKTKLTKVTTGHVIELSGNDIPYVSQIIWPSHYMWIGPLKALFGFGFLYNMLGRSVLAGYAAIALLAPIQFFLIRLSSHWGKKRWKTQDERTQLMSEVITGMRVIKMYCWEKPFGKILSKLRKTQLNHSWYKEIYDCLLLELHQVNTRLVGVAVVITAVILNDGLQTTQILSLLSTMTAVNHTLFTTATWGLKHLIEAMAAMERVQNFLLLAEDDQTQIEFLSRSDSQNSICLEDVSARWNKDAVGLENVELSVRRGDLAVIIGQVGAGKLLSGELRANTGSVSRAGSVIYAPQEPWIFTGTLRDNLLLGNTYNPLRYQEVMEATALSEDVSALPEGDATLIGDRGVTLSGGQKARLSLARAMYQDADIYLLDDPLSAVDTAVGRHIFNKCIMGYMKGKTRILVTHQLQYVREADTIIVMDQGRITCQGTYKAVAQSGVNLSKMLPIDPVITEHCRTEVKSTTKIAEFKSVPERELESLETESTWKTMKDYFSCNPNMSPLYWTVVLNIAARVLTYASDWWLAVGNSQTEAAASISPSTYVISVLLLSACLFAIGIARGLTFNHYTLALAHQSHDKMYQSVVRSPILFFDQNPSGRILNRFSSDLHVMDNRVPYFLGEIIQQSIMLLCTVALNVYVSPWVAVPFAVLSYVVFKIRNSYVAARVDLLALESQVRPQALSHLKIIMEGLDTIRSMDKSDYMKSVNANLMDKLDGITFTYVSTYNWFQFRMMSVVAIFTTCTTLSYMMVSNYTDPTIMGLSLSYLMPLMVSLNIAARCSAHIVLMMNKVARIIQYMHLPSEAPLASSDVPKHWPTTGAIRFSCMSFRYKPEGPAILKDVTLHIGHGERIGIAGRTGAGKSSLVQALFRMAEPDGEIYIDGVRTSSLGLHDVRNNISIIPQDPVLFSGSVRHNLDPFEEFSDDKLWKTLAEVQLDNAVRELPDALHNAVVEGGANFSVGQRQLLCLARAILKQNKILVMDEATSNVDRETDEIIQGAIKRAFADSTVLTVAHRLNTIMDADRIMVLNSGRVVEFDSPHVLLAKADGVLARLVSETGSAEEQRLRTLAKQAHERQTKTKVNPHIHQN